MSDILQTKLLTLAHCTQISEDMEFVHFFMLHMVRYNQERFFLKFYFKHFWLKNVITCQAVKLLQKYFGGYIAPHRKILGRR